MNTTIPDWATFRYTHPGAEPILLPGENAYDVLQAVGMDLLPAGEIARLRYLEKRDGKRWVPATHPEKLFHLENADGDVLTLFPMPEVAAREAQTCFGIRQGLRAMRVEDRPASVVIP